MGDHVGLFVGLKGPEKEDEILSGARGLFLVALRVCPPHISQGSEKNFLRVGMLQNVLVWTSFSRTSQSCLYVICLRGEVLWWCSRTVSAGRGLIAACPSCRRKAVGAEVVISSATDAVVAVPCFAGAATVLLCHSL